MTDTVVDITMLMDRLTALESAVQVLQTQPTQPGSADVDMAIAKVHELVRAWNQVPINGWRAVGDF